LYQYDIWYMSLCIGDRPVCRLGWNCILDGHLHRVTYTRYRIDTIDSPDDEHMAARNMYRTEINIYEKVLCVKLVIKYNYTGLKYYVTDFCHLLSTSQSHQHTTLRDMLLLLHHCQIS
jgi:hypothetical protein